MPWLKNAMQVMDEGYLAQGYYQKQNAMINLHGKKEETFTFDDYSWTEHISRKCALYTDAHLRTAYEKDRFQMSQKNKTYRIDTINCSMAQALPLSNTISKTKSVRFLDKFSAV